MDKAIQQEKPSAPVRLAEGRDTEGGINVNQSQTINNRGLSPGGRPFCWLEKEALLRIMERVEPPNATTAIAVYVAMTWIASDKKADNFQATVGYIAAKAGVSPRTVHRRLEDLSQIGLIRVEPVKLLGTKSNEPSRYHLMALCQEVKSPCQNLLPTTEDHGGRDIEEEKKEGESDRPVEFPKGFPKTEAEAIERAPFSNCPPEIAAQVWYEAAGRGGRDCYGQLITRWQYYLSGRVASFRSRTAERQAKFSFTPTTPDHKKGF